jgi:hypothetical protein
MITIKNILEIYGIDSNKVKLVRHGNKEIPVCETFLTDIKRFEAYQGFQTPNKLDTDKNSKRGSWEERKVVGRGAIASLKTHYIKSFRASS